MTNFAQTKLLVRSQEISVIQGGVGAAPAHLVVPVNDFIEVLQNGVRIVGRHAIADGDQVTVRLSQTPPQRLADVQVARDQLTATLKVTLTPGVLRTLRPQGPAAEVVLEVVEQPVPVAPFEFAELRSAIAQAGVTHHIDETAVMQLAARRSSGECICARGVPAQPGDPAGYDLSAQPAELPQMAGIYSLQPVLAVESGQAVAVYRPARPGVPGQTVTGRILMPPPLPERTPRLGSGVELQPDGVVRALRAGRVVYNPGWIDVVESLVHERSLAAADGYLFFPGDVVIRGDVLEGVQVVAGGCVFVGGSVSGAKISGEAGIVVTGGVFASTLRAGMGKAVQQDLREKLSSFTAEAEQFVLGAEQVEQALRQRGAHVSFGAVCDRLLTDKYVSFQSWPNQLADWLTRHNGAVHAQWVALVQRIQQDFSPGRLRLAQGAHELRQKLDELRVQCDRLLDGEHHIADIEVRYAQNSVLSASGSITARQKGFYQCRMEAGRAIEARGSGGIILGGMASAASVVAREIGSELGGATEIHLSEHGTVQAEVIHPDTVLCIEGVQHRVNRPMRRAKWP